MVRKLEIKSNLEKIIDKGGSVSADKTNDTKYHIMSLRIHAELNERINILLKNSFGISKTSWIMQAILDKLRREESENLT